MTNDVIPEQKVFNIPTPRGGKSFLPNTNGRQAMIAISYIIFPDRPQIVSDHWNNSNKFCKCIDCMDYFGEECRKCNSEDVIASKLGKRKDAPLGFECGGCAREW